MHRVEVIDDPDRDGRAIAECLYCCSAVSGPVVYVENWADNHEDLDDTFAEAQ